MPETARILRHAAHLIDDFGLHTGDQFAAPNSALDVCAAIYIAAHGHVPPEFYTDEDASLALIGASAPAMAAIRAVSDSLPTEPSVTEVAPGYAVPDHIEHVSNWAATAPPVGDRRPPTASEVIGRLLRTADHLDTAQQRPHAA